MMPANRLTGSTLMPEKSLLELGGGGDAPEL
jgi:hypothetical protein